jgi:hypothetical protein
VHADRCELVKHAGPETILLAKAQRRSVLKRKWIRGLKAAGIVLSPIVGIGGTTLIVKNWNTSPALRVVVAYSVLTVIGLSILLALLLWWRHLYNRMK